MPYEVAGVSVMDLLRWAPNGPTKRSSPRRLRRSQPPNLPVDAKRPGQSAVENAAKRQFQKSQPGFSHVEVA